MERDRENDVYSAMQRFTKAFYQGEVNDPEEKEYNFPEEKDPDSD